MWTCDITQQKHAGGLHLDFEWRSTAAFLRNERQADGNTPVSRVQAQPFVSQCVGPAGGGSVQQKQAVS